MKHVGFALLFVLVVAGCTQKPAPVASETAPVDPAERVAIAVEYVAVPSASIYANPSLDAKVVGTYGLTEAVSILEKRDGWCMVRTFDGFGWVRQADLMSAKQAEATDTLTPRFYIEPKKIPFRTHGEILIQARVDTDGRVIDTKTVKNTTGSAALAVANENALKEAKFYPVVDKGTRKIFVYEHRVNY